MLWKGFPTYASTQTIFTILKAGFHLQENQYVKVDPLSKWDVVVPGQHELGLTVPWGGTSHPVWFKNDPRVANVKVAGGVMNRPVMLGVPRSSPRAHRGHQEPAPRPVGRRPPAKVAPVGVGCRPGRTRG